MGNLKGTKTFENLMKAFSGESQARNRYTYYASIARKEGFRQIEAIFIETADNEREHAKKFYKYMLANLEGQIPADVEITATFPVAQGKTIDNLKAAAAGENEEWVDLYPEFADIADAEGFPEIATSFRMIAKAEEKHEARFLKLASNIENDTVFKKDSKTLWKCRNCGYIHEGEFAPTVCPACDHPQEHFEVAALNY